MAIIDPDGLFNGDRLRKCSDTARLVWPHLFLLANGFGRFEINYSRIATEVFAGFKNPPSEQEVYGWIKEYRDAHLLFLYEAKGGQVWGQWDCKKGSLPRYQTANDKRSPEPPKEAYESWHRSYHEQSKPLPRISKIFENLPKSCGNFPSGIGEGVGVGVGEGKNKTSSPPDGGALFGLTSEEPDAAERRRWKRVKFLEFWGVVWLKTGKLDAERAWARLVKTPAIADQIIEAAKLQAPKLLSDASRACRTPIHPATWLNKGRWGDEIQPEESTATGTDGWV